MPLWRLRRMSIDPMEMVGPFFTLYPKSHTTHNLSRS